MDQVLQYEIPVLHPIAVHFPIALLVGAAIVAAVWLVRGTGFWRNSLAIISVMGALGAAFAYFTGEAMEEASEGNPIVEEIGEFHETLGLITLIVTLVATIGVGVVAWTGSRRGMQTDPMVVRLIVFALVAAAAVLVLITGHAGGVMVWGVAR
ncbi:MAG: hypothetical protein KJO98_02630 [Rhodothermia bacterium]|nr:hypothetical protein [Rhodothermia bacterium]